LRNMERKCLHINRESSLFAECSERLIFAIRGKRDRKAVVGRLRGSAISDGRSGCLPGRAFMPRPQRLSVRPHFDLQRWPLLGVAPERRPVRSFSQTKGECRLPAGAAQGSSPDLNLFATQGQGRACRSAFPISSQGAGSAITLKCSSVSPIEIAHPRSPRLDSFVIGVAIGFGRQ